MNCLVWFAPIFLRREEADLFYYEDTKAVNPPKENKRRILADWGLGGKQKHGHNHLPPDHTRPAPRRGARPQPLPQ